MKKIKINLDWTFAKSLQPKQQQLIDQLKPDVVKWSQDAFGKLYTRLNCADQVTQSVMGIRSIKTNGVWMFNAMIHNRDIGTDIIAMVADSEAGADLMRDSFLQAAETVLGAPVRMGAL